jgi:hypothetical protein
MGGQDGLDVAVEIDGGFAVGVVLRKCEAQNG